MRGRITSIAVLGVVAIGLASLFFWESNQDSPHGQRAGSHGKGL